MRGLDTLNPCEWFAGGRRFSIEPVDANAAVVFALLLQRQRQHAVSLSRAGRERDLPNQFFGLL